MMRFGLLHRILSHTLLCNHCVSFAVLLREMACFYGISIPIKSCKLFSASNLSPPFAFVDGRISDAIGRKNTLIFASGTFFIGSLLCGAAPNFWSLVAA